ncbi:hypothetical protein O6H91_05G082800 [Diphasiastrum complanatum]|uniref:Uncharacterized protein n=2 Tax=Diphasiastrum complanatum TaxID=34168 RepID=A0ACC2DQ50_DIPCM|nr:hypothetical protein O6H91_05G082500 [Diphasiastrum complanatum]KAJ7556424.1 hypothetical protein O6H91_05G082800 [Diphasiastrum complanatum]
MDIITQLQDQVNKMAYLTYNTVGTLQRDAPPSRLSQIYPEPTAAPPDTAAVSAEQPKVMASTLVEAAKQFDALVAALPVAEGGEETQMKRIAQLQAENEEVGKELKKELEAADNELKEVRGLFHVAADNCLRFKPPR